MKTLLKNGTVVNVFTGTLEKADVLLEDDRIIGVDLYEDADHVVDVTGKFICPGFLDGHFHIESTMLCPAEFARVCVPHGTTSVVADPHEMANVCGTKGLDYMLQASQGLPMTVYIALPSCVPSTPFDESGAVLEASNLHPFYDHPRVVSLGEVMNYPGVIYGDPQVHAKLSDAREKNAVINGHAPLLTGRELDKYLSAGIGDDHECSSPAEAMERIRKGQFVMIRQGTAAQNLVDLLPLFDASYAHRCMLVSDDKHPADLLQKGHLDDAIRLAVSHGKSPITAIQMATIQPAQYYGLRRTGAVAPGYRADLLVLDDLNTVTISKVWQNGLLVAENGQMLVSPSSCVAAELEDAVRSSFKLDKLSSADFSLDLTGKQLCRVIDLIPQQLLTNEIHETIDFGRNNGMDLDRDLVKLAVLERHHGTGHKGLGFLHGSGLKAGALASSVSHDSHNLIVIGTSEEDMAVAANRVREQGGCVVVRDGVVLAELPLPIAGLMSDAPAPVVAKQNEALREAIHTLGVPEDIELFMTTAFVSLAVIPHLKMTTLGLIDVEKQKLLPLLV